jgi:hypothetical protein
LITTPIPLPSHFHIHWGEPLRFNANHDDDDEVILPLVEEVRSAVRRLIEHGLEERERIF